METVKVGDPCISNGLFSFQFPEYPLQFPTRDWPRIDDPSFIGIFYSRCKIGQLNGNEEEEYARRRPGVYFR